MNDTPYVITVAALNADGLKASYSSVGSNIWVAAPTGEYGVDSPASLTTDQFGRMRGYSSRNWPGIARDAIANPYGDYISNFNGTSAATPHVAGVVALLLEEQPELTWRDVKHVFANTSRRPGENIRANNDVQVMINGQLATIQRDWVENAAGYAFHNHFGFGAVDVDAAIAYLRDDFQVDRFGTQIETTIKKRRYCAAFGSNSVKLSGLFSARIVACEAIPASNYKNRSDGTQEHDHFSI